MPAAHTRAAHVRGAATHTDTAAAKMRGATAEVCGAAAHMHSAAATPEVGTAATPAEVSAAATAAAEMCTPAAAAETGVRRISRSRQTKGESYCGRARRDFPHGMTSSSGPNA
jgi:hypothetical protein